MTERLLELVQARYNDLFPPSRTADAVTMQKNAWQYITETINQEFPNNIPPGGLTVHQIQTRWKNVKASGKEDYQQKKK